jgi:hypothetical protein
VGKKPQRYSWPEAKKLCRLNQDDIEMAKRLGFRPDALIRNRPHPKQKWKLPVKYWVRALYEKRFGEVLGEKTLPEPAPFQWTEDDQRRFEEEMYWEDYWDRNSDGFAKGQAQVHGSASQSNKLEVEPTPSTPELTEDDLGIQFSDDDVPF